MARYAPVDALQHQLGKNEDFFLVDSNPPAISAPSFSFREANAFRSALNPSDAAAAIYHSLPDEWSGTTNAVPDTPHQQQQWLAQNSNLSGGPLWPGSHESLDGSGGGNDYAPDKKPRIEKQDSFDEDHHRRLPPAVGLHGYIGDENLRKVQALQRQGSALEANQRIINALYSSRQAPSLQGAYHQLDQLKARQLTTSGHFVDGNLLRQYGIQHLVVDPSHQQQSLLQGHNYQPPFQSINHPVFQVQYQQQGGANPLYSQPRLQVAYGLKPEGIKHPLSLAAYAKCSQVLTLCIQEQRRKPSDNSVQFWRNLFQTFFAENATQRWCLSCYNSCPVGRHAQGLFPMDHWKCNLCVVEPGRGFEAGVDVLPRLFKIKFDSGLLEELFFLELPDERYALSSGFAVFEYARAVHESSFPEVRICSWEFCTKSHEEVVPRKNLLQQVHQLSNLVHEVEKESFDASVENLKNHCNAFHLAAKQLAVKIDAPSVNDLGFSKRYIRCLQIAEVVSSMEDLVTFSKKAGLGPIESLAKFPNLRKRPLDDSSPQSSITYLPSHPDNNRLSSPPATPYHHPPPPELRGHYLPEQQQHSFSLQQQAQDFVAQARAKSGLQQHPNATHSSMRTATVLSAGQQSLPGTPQSEMSDLRSNAN
ncbi:hypothetical protein SELMODRAFT_442531 [Selaginella moellendorffii]|uniref:Uncharacterized protein n=1 Tax=Selaginella moellendorffii TaxID=88036 RepID=D8RUW3_SELML|nr:hypothetical protein SELMODRAFT_442531 [Selaginella moellendorffii]